MLDNIMNEDKVINFDEDTGAALLRAVVLAKNNVPYSHKRIADNYVVIKRMYKFHAVKAAVSNTEYALLQHYNMQSLEMTSANRMTKEIEFLKNSSNGNDLNLKKDADMIMLIRAKELKNITASTYTKLSEMNNGYKALNKYFEEITKFNI